MSSWTRQQLENYLKTIDVKADRIIDIGGSQNSIKGRTKSWEVKEYKILDLEKPHECKQKPDIVFDLNSQNNEMGYILDGGKFDVIFCLEVFEYIYSPMDAMRNIYDLLKDKGILYISFSFIYPVHEPVDQDYLRYTPRGAFKLLKETGFTIDEFESRMLTPEGEIRYNDLLRSEGMRPAKNHSHNQVGLLIKAQKI